MDATGVGLNGWEKYGRKKGENKKSYAQKRQNLIKNDWAARKSFIRNLFNCLICKYAEILIFHAWLCSKGLSDSIFCWTQNWSGRPWHFSCPTPLADICTNVKTPKLNPREDQQEEENRRREQENSCWPIVVYIE